jgi:hypothetical protein
MYKDDHIESEFMKRQKKNPFQTPDGYFDSLDERIMAGIKPNAKTKSTSGKIIRLLKPAFGLAASLLLVGLLVYSPVKTLLLKNNAQPEFVQSTPADLFDNLSFDLATIDDNTLANTIFTDETSNATTSNPDELLSYLSSNLNEVEIYSEIQNN